MTPPVQTPALRACELCDHHRQAGGELRCAHPIVAGAHGTVACETARNPWHGGCGRDANHMQWAPLQAIGRPNRPTLWATQP